MCVGWLFDSNQNEITVIRDDEFNSTLASNTVKLSPSIVLRTQRHKHIFGGNGFLESPQRQKTNRNKCHSTKSRTQPKKHYLKEDKNFKNTAYHLHTASTICKEKLECTNRNDCNKSWGSYSMQLALLTLLIGRIKMLHWQGNYSLLWITHTHSNIYISEISETHCSVTYNVWKEGTLEGLCIFKAPVRTAL
jgi:hypothetical protein